MPEDADAKPRQPVEINLEPLPDVVVDPNVGYQAAYYPGVNQRGDNGLPVPNREGHLCPKCNYDVRGLSGRICPECGAHFSIGETRIAGSSKAPDHKLDLRVITQQQWTVNGGILLFLAALVAPHLVARSLPNWSDVALQLIFLMPFALIGMMFCYCLMRPSREGLFVAALLYAAFSVILIFVG